MESEATPLLVPITSGPGGVGAKLGGLGRTKIYDLIDRRELTKVNIGRRAFITAKSIAAYVDRLAEAASDMKLPPNAPQGPRRAAPEKS